MQKEIEIRHCSICQPVSRDENKYQTDIIATSCFWRENLDVNYSLQEVPIQGQTYIVVLNQPVRFHLHMKLWLFYDCPLAEYNGYEKEEEIEAARFCFGQITKIITYDHFCATVEFTVKQTLSFQEIIETRTAKDLPESWSVFFTDFIKSNNYWLEQLGNYYVLGVSVQSDLGQICIITKSGDDYFICMLNEHCFSENATYGGKYKLPENIKTLIKI